MNGRHGRKSPEEVSYKCGGGGVGAKAKKIRKNRITGINLGGNEREERRDNIVRLANRQRAEEEFAKGMSTCKLSKRKSKGLEKDGRAETKARRESGSLLMNLKRRNIAGRRRQGGKGRRRNR